MKRNLEGYIACPLSESKGIVALHGLILIPIKKSSRGGYSWYCRKCQARGSLTKLLEFEN